jgi:thiol-disulfide isomerase/thioredoxin
VVLVASRATKVAAAWALLAMLLVIPVSSNADTDVSPDSIETLTSVVGDSIPLAGRVVYLDFWASWCTPCRASFPWMKTLQDKYRDKGLQVVTINLDNDPAAGRKFLGEMKSPLPVFFDPKGTLAKQYQIEVMPTSFVYGRDGKLEFRHEGFQPRETSSLESKIAALLQEKATP